MEFTFLEKRKTVAESLGAITSTAPVNDGRNLRTRLRCRSRKRNRKLRGVKRRLSRRCAHPICEQIADTVTPSVGASHASIRLTVEP